MREMFSPLKFVILSIPADRVRIHAPWYGRATTQQ